MPVRLGVRAQRTKGTLRVPKDPPGVLAPEWTTEHWALCGSGRGGPSVGFVFADLAVLVPGRSNAGP